MVSLLGLLQAQYSLLLYYHVLHNSRDRSFKGTNTYPNQFKPRSQGFVEVITLDLFKTKNLPLFVIPSCLISIPEDHTDPWRVAELPKSLK